jgi:hypothetical protein
MLRKLRKPPHQKEAEKAIRETAPENGVGEFLGFTKEDSHLTSYRFKANLKGYVGWEWTAIVYQAKKSAPATISEVVLLPGEGAIVAPAWIPWSERRAELERLKAAELATLDLEEAKDSEGDSKQAAKRKPVRQRTRRKLIDGKDSNQTSNPEQSPEQDS